MVDQSPIGKTTRSNPASYVGAFDAIRKLFAAEPLARERGYSAGTFSFNSGDGRCPTCHGNGFEHVEMQFLSDVYLRCPDCDGKRYRSIVLEVKISGKSIADVLEMTVNEACEFFTDKPEALRGLEPLRSVGLGYMKLGQPVPTLSGGEAQRLKLAGHLAQTTNARTLFLFDEPTTGLHFDDIATLLKAFNQLLARGHSVVVIEHNLDVIRAADWIIDLGPEGGDAGGESRLRRHAGGCGEMRTQSYRHRAAKRTVGQAARLSIPSTSEKTGGPPVPRSESRNPHPQRPGTQSQEHRCARFRATSSPSSPASAAPANPRWHSTFFLPKASAAISNRSMPTPGNLSQPATRPDVDAIFGIPPTVAIEQRTSRGGRKSTVATVTEVYHFLRLLFVKLGTQYCPDCNIPIQPQTPEAILARLVKDYRGQPVELFAPLIVARKGYYTDLAQWALRKGFSNLRVDGELLPTAKWPRFDRFKEHNIELPVGTCEVTPKRETELRELLETTLEFGKGTALVKNQMFSTRRACPKCARSFPELDPRLFSFNSKHGWCPSCYGTGLLFYGFNEEHTGEEAWWNEWFEGKERPCPECKGTRLRREALAVRFQQKSIADLAALSVNEAADLFAKMKLRGREAEIARDIVAELRSRLEFLKEVGLPYLSLDRAAPTLSGGEAQRIRLAAQLGSNLRGVCYILDEPTIGLHPRDNQMLLDTLA